MEDNGGQPEDKGGISTAVKMQEIPKTNQKRQISELIWNTFKLYTVYVLGMAMRLYLLMRIDAHNLHKPHQIVKILCFWTFIFHS